MDVVTYISRDYIVEVDTGLFDPLGCNSAEVVRDENFEVLAAGDPVLYRVRDPSKPALLVVRESRCWDLGDRIVRHKVVHRYVYEPRGAMTS